MENLSSHEILASEGCPLMQETIDGIVTSQSPTQFGQTGQPSQQQYQISAHYNYKNPNHDPQPSPQTHRHHQNLRIEGSDRKLGISLNGNSSDYHSADYKLLDISNDSKNYGSSPRVGKQRAPEHNYESLKRPFQAGQIYGDKLPGPLPAPILLIQTSTGNLCFPRESIYSGMNGLSACTGEMINNNPHDEDASLAMTEQNLINKYFPATTLNKFRQANYSLHHPDKTMYDLESFEARYQAGPSEGNSSEEDESVDYEYEIVADQGGTEKRNLTHFHYYQASFASASHTGPTHPTLSKSCKYQRVSPYAYSDPVGGGMLFQNGSLPTPNSHILMAANEAKELAYQQHLAAAQQYYQHQAVSALSQTTTKLNPKKHRSTTDQMLYSAKSRLKSEISGKCDWKKLALILILCSLLSLILISYLLAVSLGRLNWNLKTNPQDLSLNSHSRSRDPSISYSPLLRRSPGPELSPTYYPGRYVELLLESKNLHFLKLKLKQPSSSRGRFEPSPLATGHLLYFNLTFDRLDTVIGVYFRKNELPSHVQYDHMEIINGQDKLGHQPDYQNDRQTRSLDYEEVVYKNKQGPGELVVKREAGLVTYAATFARYLEGDGSAEGAQWYMALYNDDQARDITIGLNSVLELGPPTPLHERPSNALEPFGSSNSCPQNCHGAGRCDNGICRCFPGYSGWDCGKMVCPVLCSGNGVFHNGDCHCHKGWKGTDCAVRSDKCIMPDCNGKGFCQEGTCLCRSGYKGISCEQMDCNPSDCSGHGKCVSIIADSHHSTLTINKCLCNAGFAGDGCQIDLFQHYTSTTRCRGSKGQSNMDQYIRGNIGNISAVLGGQVCSGNGLLKGSTSDSKLNSACECFPGWSGSLCDRRECNAICLKNGAKCSINGDCICPTGRMGPDCSILTCLQSCHNHGDCQGGTCFCHTGWNGKYCSINGCPGNCNKNGACLFDTDAWACNCKFGWAGKDCTIMLETSCTDNIDNDSDGLIDCQDPECCSHQACRNDILCKSAPDPQEVLLTKQPPNVMASFFARVKFLLEENSVQIQPSFRAFNESMVSVVKGKVVDENGQPMVGARISVESETAFGYTFSRHNGEFDFLVNGGAIVSLILHKEPYKQRRFRIYVAPNDFHLMAHDIALELVHTNGKRGKKVSQASAFCEGLTSIPCPLIYANPSPFTTRFNPTPTSLVEGRAPLYSEISPSTKINLADQSLRQTFNLPEVDIKLVYLTRKTSGYKSALHVQLLSEVVPKNLSLIHLKIDIQGLRYEKVLEAEPNLVYTQYWEKRNSYRQTVYGLAKASVLIGYQYGNCHTIVWAKHATKIMGQELPISDIGDWNLDIHHRFDYRQGILYKGNGQTIFLRENGESENASVALQTILGDGKRGTPTLFNEDQNKRPHSLNGPGSMNRLVDPQRLAISSQYSTSEQGSIITTYLGDYNVIYRLSIKVTLNGQPTSTSHEFGGDTNYGAEQYHHQSPVASTEGPNFARLLRILEKSPVLVLDPSIDPSNKYEMAVHPITGTLFVSLARQYRIVKVKTTGDLSHNHDVNPGKWKALRGNWENYAGTGESCTSPGGQGQACETGMPASKTRLTHPKSLTFDKDGTLYFIDAHSIKYITDDGIIHNLLGTESKRMDPNPKGLTCNETRSFNQMEFVWPIELSYNNYDSSLYVLDDDSVVYKLDLLSRTVTTLLASSSNKNRAEICWFDSSNSVYTPGQVRKIAFSPMDGTPIVTLLDPSTNVASIVRLSLNSIAAPANTIASSQSGEGNDSSTSQWSNKLYDSLVNPSDLAFSPDGSFAIITDRGDLRLKAISLEPNQATDWSFKDGPRESSSLVKTNEEERYSLVDWEAGLTYGFNRYGNHIETRDLIEARVMYRFSYTLNSYLGKLKSVTYSKPGTGTEFQQEPSHTLRLNRDFSSNGVNSLVIYTNSHPSSATPKFTCDLGRGNLAQPIAPHISSIGKNSFKCWEGDVVGTSIVAATYSYATDNRQSIASGIATQPSHYQHMMPPPLNGPSMGISSLLSAVFSGQPSAALLADITYTTQGRVLSWSAPGGLDPTTFFLKTMNSDAWNNGFTKISEYIDVTLLRNSSINALSVYAFPIRVYKTLAKADGHLGSSKDNLFLNLMMSEGQCILSSSSQELGGLTEPSFNIIQLSRNIHVSANVKIATKKVIVNARSLSASPGFYFNYHQYLKTIHVEKEKLGNRIIRMIYTLSPSSQNSDTIEKVLIKGPLPAHYYKNIKGIQYDSKDSTYQILKIDGKDVILASYGVVNDTLNLYNMQRHLLTLNQRSSPDKTLLLPSLRNRYHFKNILEPWIESKPEVVSTFNGYALYFYMPGARRPYVIDYETNHTFETPRIIVQDPIGVRSIVAFNTMHNYTEFNDGTLLTKDLTLHAIDPAITKTEIEMDATKRTYQIAQNTILSFCKTSGGESNRLFNVALTMGQESRLVLNLSYNLGYDAMGRVSSVNKVGNIGAGEFASYNLTYDESNGQLSGTGEFSFNYPVNSPYRKIVATDGTFLISQDLTSPPLLSSEDGSSLLGAQDEETMFKLGPTLVYSYELNRNRTNRSLGHLVHRVVENFDPKLLPTPGGGGSAQHQNGHGKGTYGTILHSRNLAFTYTHRGDNNVKLPLLKHISQDGSAYSYAFHYDSSIGQLKGIKIGATERSIGRGNKALGYGQNSEEGERGRVTYRRGQALIYDGRGRLVEMRRSDQSSIDVGVADPSSLERRTFGYDQLDRLLYVYDHAKGHLDLFLYLLDTSTNPSQYYKLEVGNGKTLSSMSFTYSPGQPEAKLVSIRRNGQSFYVITDAWNSPVAVLQYSARGGEPSCLKSLEYNPLGDVLRDSNTAFDLPIGFKGGIRDSGSDIIFYGAAAYDPYLGDLLNPSPLLPHTNSREAFCFYCTTTPSQQFTMQDGINVKELLTLAGTNVKNLIPKILIEDSDVKSRVAWLISMLPRSTNIFGVLNHFTTRQDVYSAFIPNLAAIKKSQFSQYGGSILGKGIVVNFDSKGYLQTKLIEGHDTFASNASILVNEAILVQLPNTRNAAGKMMVYLVKESQERSNKDLWELAIKSKTKYLDAQTKITVSQINENLNICLEGRHQIISVTYGTTVKQEKARLSKIYNLLNGL